MPRALRAAILAAVIPSLRSTSGTDLDRELGEAQAALLGRYAPATRVRRVRWSQGGTQVLELGAGPPLLLVHGGGDGAFEWVPILTALARTRRVLAVDRPGHGLSDPFDYGGVDLLDHGRTFLGDILDALELTRTDIAANSIGGLLSAAFASDAPDRVSRLVLVGAPPGVTREAPLPLRLMSLPLVGQPLGRLMMRNMTREGNRKFWGQLQVAHPERLEDGFLDVDVAHSRRNRDSILSLIRCTGGLIRARLTLGGRWPMPRIPTLFLQGEHDAFITRRAENAWEAIATDNPNLRVLRIPDAGHLPWLDQPERVVAEIERFLATQPRQRKIGSVDVFYDPALVDALRDGAT
jgi:2-hydroxy-6-oxonona-2,4-dienedioate hydrolase